METWKLVCLWGIALQTIALMLSGLEFFGERAATRATRAIARELAAAEDGVRRVLKGDSAVWGAPSRSVRIALMAVVAVAGLTYAYAWQFYFATKWGMQFMPWYERVTNPYLDSFLHPPYIGTLIGLPVSLAALVLDKYQKHSLAQRIASTVVILGFWPFFLFAGGIFLIPAAGILVVWVLGQAAKAWSWLSEEAARRHARPPVYLLALLLAVLGSLLQGLSLWMNP